MPASIRTLSQLPRIDSNSIDNRSLFEVSIPVDISLSGPTQHRIYKYASKAITKENLSKKLIEETREDLIEKNGLYEDIKVNELCATVSSILSSDLMFYGQKEFDKNPKIDNAPLSNYSFTDNSLDDYSVNFGTLKKYSSINSSPSIGPTFGFVTRLSGIQNGSNEQTRLLNIFSVNENNQFTQIPSFVFDEVASKNIAEAEYIFKIESGERSSKEWTAPASGIFTCYGWLDEINNPAQSNESRWVALMGYQEQLNVWTILQIQPFIRNNYLSYVGFTFPVKKGMKLKVITGFAVGSNSDKYFASNSSIANHVANAFLGGVYTGLSVDNGDGTPADYDNVPPDYVKREDLTAYVTREEEDICDLSTTNAISAVSAFLNDKIDNIKPGGDTIVNNYNVFIDTEKLSTGVDNGGMTGRTLYIGKDAGYNGTKYFSQPDYSSFYIGAETSKQPGLIYNGHPFKLISDSTTHTFNDPNYYVNNNKTYRRVDGPDGAAENEFYTDDYFWYYTTKYDSLVQVLANPDWSGYRTAVQIYLRYLNEEGAPCFKMLAAGIETSMNATDSMINTSIPLKKGSTIAIAAFTNKEETRTTVTRNLSNKEYAAGTNTSPLKISTSITATSGTDKERNSASDWPANPTEKQISLLGSLDNDYIKNISNIVVNTCSIGIDQIAGKCSIYVRLTNDDGTVVGQEKYMNANDTKQTTLTWTNLSFGKSKNLHVQVAYGEPTETTTTRLWIKNLKATATYTYSYNPMSANGIAAPVFSATKVSDLIDTWKSSGTARSQIVQPHNIPSWVALASKAFLASVTMLGLSK